jgi:DNA primase
MALKAGLEIRFLAAPGDGKIDPDVLFLERGLAAYDEVKRGALSAMTFATRSILPSPETASAEHKTRASQSLFEIITATESETTRAQFLEEIATSLRLPLSAIQRDFDVFRRRHSKIAAPAPSSSADVPASPATKTINTSNTPEHLLLLMCLHFEQFGKPLSTILPHNWIDTSHLPGSLLNRFLGEFEHDAWPGRDNLEGLLENPEEKTLVASLLFDPPRTEEPVRAINQALVQIRARYLEPQRRQIELALATHGPDSNSDAFSLSKELIELHRQLRAPIGLPAAV